MFTKQLSQNLGTSWTKNCCSPAFAPQLSALSKQANISEAIVAKVFEVGKFGGPQVDVARFVFLMLAMSCGSFSSLASGMFEVFGESGKLQSDTFLKLIGHLAPAMDPDFTPELLDKIRAAVTSSVITLDDVRCMPMLQAKLSQG